MADLVLPPLAIDADPSTNLPEYSGAAVRAAFSALTWGLGGSDIRPRNGVLSQGAFKVSLSGSNVMVAPGSAVVAYSTGGYIATQENALVVGALASADATNSRIDRVVLRIDDPSNGGTTDRSGSVQIIRGASAANPSAPAVSGTNVYLELAQINVPRSGGGSPSVTDKRTFTAAAGGVLLTGPSSLASVSSAPGAVAYDTSTNTLNVRTNTSWRPLLTEDDTGWVNVPINRGYSRQGSQNPQVRRIGKTIHWRWGFSGAGFSANNNVVVANVPAGFRPSGTTVYASLQSNSPANAARVYIETNGNVNVQPADSVGNYYVGSFCYPVD